jgi:hypothetical protein|eukprot:6576860-Prymnesium_polylepis.1
MRTRVAGLCRLWLPLVLAQTYPELESLPAIRLRGGEGLPQMSGNNFFGSALALHDDKLAVGSSGSPGNGGTRRGSVWIVGLDTNGSALSYVEIGDGTNATGANATISLEDNAFFGAALAWLGDLDGDGNLGALRTLNS